MNNSLLVVSWNPRSLSLPDNLARSVSLILTKSGIFLVIPHTIWNISTNALLTILHQAEKRVTTFDRYLLGRFLYVFCVLFISMFGLFVVIDGFTNVDGFQQGRNGALEILIDMATYYGLQSTVFFNLIGGIFAVTSVMIVLGLLRRNSEIHPLLAAGIPTFRLAVPFLIGMLIITSIVIVNQEVIIPSIGHRLIVPLGRKADSVKGQDVKPIYDFRTGLHIAGDELFLHNKTMSRPRFLLPMGEIAQELTTLSADEAVFHAATADVPSGWVLQNVTPQFSELNLTDSGKEIVKPLPEASSVFVVTDVSFDQLVHRSGSYKFASTLELIHRVRNPSFDLVSLRGQTMQLHTRMVQPFFNIVSVFLTIPLVIRRESRGLIKSLLISSLVLITVLGLWHACVYLGQANIVAPELAPWIPVVFSGGLVAWLTGSVQT